MEKKHLKSILSINAAKKFFTFLSKFAKKEKPVYNLKSVKIPRTSGRALKILAFFLRTPGTRSLMIPILLRQAGIQSLRKLQIEDEPIMHPVHPSNKKITASLAKKSVKHFFDSFEKKEGFDTSIKFPLLKRKAFFALKQHLIFIKHILKEKHLQLMLQCV